MVNYKQPFRSGTREFNLFLTLWTWSWADGIERNMKKIDRDVKSICMLGLAHSCFWELRPLSEETWRRLLEEEKSYGERGLTIPFLVSVLRPHLACETILDHQPQLNCPRPKQLPTIPDKVENLSLLVYCKANRVGKFIHC